MRDASTLYTDVQCQYNQQMENLIKHIKSRISLTQEEVDIIETYFLIEEIEPQTSLLKAGKTERYIYFLSRGIVRGYQNVNGKLIIEHLVDEHNFFASIESFMNETPAPDYFESIASFLGMEPQSLSRIRKQITF